MAIIIPMSNTVVMEFKLLLSFKNLSINQINRKLQISAGLNTINGRKRLAPVMYIKAGRKLGFANRLWLLIIRLKVNAWINTKTVAKKTLADGEKAFSRLMLMSSLANGSRKSKFN